ncbi:hypothetical protein DTO166G4_1491 [Paecilomyces variotii]|nr:hypothetical protein DTO166G4_1491 [Paecilomyces variotii]KAJ9226149.1 hypothetical protein DTO169C6_1362 [Paecilomyces variotii]KAJ9242629.1 hypothetical protein DTO166G5_384 [Paecilomyces variotii]KAJ9266571.1 hypothetical protein DTO195F2_1094 [Paecilomyces variotii]KAJ9329193.1 hypothetical protein DTO027B3_593 [Paecilomyces variotii]
MTAPRLPFLYPNIVRSLRSCEPATYRSLRPRSRSRFPRADFHTSQRCEQETSYHRRYGPAVEAKLPPPERPKDKPGDQSSREASSQRDSSQDQRSDAQPEQAQAQDPNKTTARGQSGQEKKSAVDASSTNLSAELPPEENANPDEDVDDVENSDPSPRQRKDEARQAQPASSDDNPLQDVLQMPSPSSYLTPSGVSAANGQKPPHLTPPPYVHHFDTYSLVRDLAKSGFTDEQSVTMMKAIRGILQDNLELARESLTSKSDVENESYLFKAACSELQQSLQASRNAEIQRQRTSRTQLQHEVDILSQRLNQELTGLKDDLKGMFNDHKMTTRELQRSLDTAIQELNYKITVSLNSDGKSEAEGLRWILTRRAAMAIATSAIMIILFLRYYSYKTSQKESKKAKEAAAKEAAETEVKDTGVQTEASIAEQVAPEILG